MRTIMKTYARFADLVTGTRILENPDLDFRTICRFLHVSPASLNEVLMDELGMDGREVLDKLRFFS